MKLALNGALTIGTLDGANIEIANEVGNDNIFIFGLTTDELAHLRASGYRAADYYQANADLRQVIDMIASGYFSPEEPDRFKPIVDNLLEHGDHYMLLADYAAYVQAQAAVEAAYRDQAQWLRKAILNVANMGRFSSDRTIGQYAQQIWHTRPVAR
jgi:glycogen phosphorylase